MLFPGGAFCVDITPHLSAQEIGGFLIHKGDEFDGAGQGLVPESIGQRQQGGHPGAVIIRPRRPGYRIVMRPDHNDLIWMGGTAMCHLNIEILIPGKCISLECHLIPRCLQLSGNIFFGRRQPLLLDIISARGMTAQRCHMALKLFGRINTGSIQRG